VKRPRFALGVLLALWAAPGLAVAADAPPPWLPSLPSGAVLEPLDFTALSGWNEDRVADAAPAFLRTCRRLVDPPTPDITGVRPPDGLLAVCRAGMADGLATPETARRFFETRFRPFLVVPASGRGFMTGYYEPEVPASLVRTPEFDAPLLSRPDDLVTLQRNEVVPGLPPELTAARKLPDGTYAPFFDRSSILDGAALAGARPLVFVRDQVEAFMVQVQGSTRVKLPDGSRRRYAYDGKNGLPYTSIGRRIVEEGHIPLEEMNLTRMKEWLRANPQQADRIMRLNRSFVFFREATDVPADAGPIGGSGVSLDALRSVAVDHGIWPYGLPVWLDAELPGADGKVETFRRLTIAQDTGGAIVGAARVDLFAGTGDAAGAWAGLLRHPVRFVVLLPGPPI